MSMRGAAPEKRRLRAGALPGAIQRPDQAVQVVGLHSVSTWSPVGESTDGKVLASRAGRPGPRIHPVPNFLPVPDQLELLLKGVETCVQKDELAAKLEASRKSGKPLRVKTGFENDQLTSTGEVLHIMLGIIGPILYGLALLSVRGRVKR